MLRRLPAISGRVSLLTCAVACVVCLSPTTAHARRLFRARFEPTTLELEEPGKLEVDLQVGGMYGDGQDGSRLVSPDFEVDLGILSWLELDVDGGFTVIHVNQNDTTRGTYGEPLWTAAKVALYTVSNAETGRSFGLGLQVGPRLPSLRTVPKVGFASLLLFGGGSRRAHVVANFGTVLDRGQAPAVVYGVDVDVTLGKRATWTLLGELGGGHYFGASTADQLIGTLGVSFQASEAVGISLIGLRGFLPGNDRLGLLAGVSTTFGLWTPPAAHLSARNGLTSSPTISSTSIGPP